MDAKSIVELEYRVKSSWLQRPASDHGFKRNRTKPFSKFTGLLPNGCVKNTSWTKYFKIQFQVKVKEGLMENLQFYRTLLSAIAASIMIPHSFILGKDAVENEEFACKLHRTNHWGILPQR